MADIAPITHHTPLYGPAGGRVDAPPPGAREASGSSAPAGRLTGRETPAERAGERPPQRPSDRVELSDRARLLSQLAALPEVRTDLVEAVRAAIEAGEYDTPERLEGALDGLLEDLQSEL